MTKSIISAIVIFSASSFIFAQSNTPTLTLKSSNIQYQYELISNPVIEEGITNNEETGEIQITGKVAKTDTIRMTVAYVTPEMKPMISDEEVAEMNAAAAEYQAKLLAKKTKTPTTLWDSCLTSANSYFPNDSIAALESAKETYRIIQIHSDTKKLAAYYTAENNRVKTAYKQAGRIQPSSKRTFN